MPKVSVIVPNYNHSRYLVERLDSIFNQTFQDFEVILLDDCSKDNSIEILTKYSKDPKVSHFVINKKNSGIPFIQWNRGIKLAQGEYIWIAESDDKADLNFLEELVLILEKNINVGFAISMTNIIDANSNIIGNYDTNYNYSFENHKAIVEGKRFLIEKMLTSNKIYNASSVLFRKSLIEQVGYANESMTFSSDWLQWIRFLSVSDIAIFNKYLNYHRAHEDTDPYLEVFFKEYFTILCNLNHLNKRRLDNKISKTFVNDKIREAFYYLLKFDSFNWREKVVKSFIILKLNIHFANILLFFGCFFNFTKLEKRFYDNLLKRNKNL